MQDPRLPRLILDDIWDELTRATKQRTDLTTLSLATVAQGNLPKVRTVILRQVMRDSNCICFATDLRSPKVAEIAGNPHVALSGYDTTNNVQIRLEGKAEINKSDAQRRAMFDSLKPHTHYLFTSNTRPSTEISAPTSIKFNTDSERMSLEAYENFALVNVQIDTIERLDLGSEPHQRIGFRRLIEGWQAKWLAP